MPRGLLAWDIVQLATLLFLTGGMDNPFTMLMVAPVTVSAATLPLRNTVALGLAGARRRRRSRRGARAVALVPRRRARAAGDVQARRVRGPVRVDDVHRPLRVAAVEGVAADVGGAHRHRHRAGARAEAARARWPGRGSRARARHSAVHYRAGDQGNGAHGQAGQPDVRRHRACSRRRPCAAARSCRS